MAAPLLVLIAGALLFSLSSNPKLAKMGEYAYFVALLWVVYLLASTHLRLLP